MEDGLWVLNCGQVPLGLFKSRDVMIVTAKLTWPFMEIVVMDDDTVWFKYDFLHGQRVMLMESAGSLIRS